MDPDYRHTNTALKKSDADRQENRHTCDKISKIIEEEFEKELSIRQKQLEEIEENIYKTQKLLHLVRYVLITSYYNKKNLEYNSSNSDYNITQGFDIQNRIHPAVKKLLGNNATLDILNLKGKRSVRDKNSYCRKALVSHLPLPKKIKLESKEGSGHSFKTEILDDNQTLLKNRRKTRYRIVVGNISKWMPSLENDNTTHKWMVYVRGMKEAVDIKFIVDKVKFYLHPSYKPHDVVEISNGPFHLSRRGWGEFPLRVQIFFKCPLNKPISIVHNLKLDKTYTGRQTLGNETVADLYLYGDDFLLEKASEKNSCKDTQGDIENIRKCITGSLELSFHKQDTVVKEEVIEKSGESLYKLPYYINSKNQFCHEELNVDTPLTSFEHNYCYEEIVKENQVQLEVSHPSNTSSSFLDHSYCLPYSEYNNSCCSTDTTKRELHVKPEDQNNKLIFGLGESYVDCDMRTSGTANIVEKEDFSLQQCVVKTLTTASGHPIRVLPQSFNKLLLNNGNVIQIKLLKKPQSVLKKIDPCTILQQNLNSQERYIDYERYKIKLSNHHFKNIGEVLPYLFKRLSLWNKLANNLDFKCTYPFIATSRVEFSSWNIGKRLSSEWSRAKTIKKILASEHFPNLEKWNTRTFFMYGRSHGYSPLSPLGTMPKKPSEELELLMACFSDSLPRNKFRMRDNVGADIDVDVTTDTEMESITALPLGKSNNVDISEESLKYHCAFIKEAALDCGVILKSEEVSEGVTMNAAERMILEAIKCFVEGIIRRSRHHLVCQEGYSENTSEITTEEIKIALNERPEIRSIFNFQKKKREMEFFL